MSGPGWENAEQCAGMRERVDQLARSHWRDALQVATEIPLPWYRVQSLAAVAKAVPDDEVDAVLAKASRDAAKDTDAFRRVAVLAWVIDAAMERERRHLAQRLFAGALVESATITPMKSRAAALEHLLERATKLG